MLETIVNKFNSLGIAQIDIRITDNSRYLVIVGYKDGRKAKTRFVKKSVFAELSQIYNVVSTCESNLISCEDAGGYHSIFVY